MGDSIDGGEWYPGGKLPTPKIHNEIERWFAWRPVRCQSNKWYWMRWMYRDIWIYDNGHTVVVSHFTPVQYMHYKLRQ